ncbi:MAG: hypothetical protein AAFR13_04335 [Pseudomonadota bacterium]
MRRTAFQEKANARIRNIIDTSSIFVIASHSNDIINMYCNRVIEFEKGQIKNDHPL